MLLKAQYSVLFDFFSGSLCLKKTYFLNIIINIWSRIFRKSPVYQFNFNSPFNNPNHGPNKKRFSHFPSEHNASRRVSSFKFLVFFLSFPRVFLFCSRVYLLHVLSESLARHCRRITRKAYYLELITLSQRWKTRVLILSPQPGSLPY